MAAKMMPGGPVADAVFADLIPRSQKLIENGHTPGLGTILVGDDGASARYVGMKMEKARELGWSAPHQHLPDDATQAGLLFRIGLLVKRSQAPDERQTRVHHRRELAREEHEIGFGDSAARRHRLAGGFLLE